MWPRYGGMTLVELLLVLSILLFLMLKVATPFFSERRQVMEIDHMMLDIQNSIALARRSAVSENTMVTYCRSNDFLHCQGNWMDGAIIFTDANADHVVNQQDRILFSTPSIKPAGQLKFAAFRNRQYLQLTPRGITDFQNGNFTFCPADGNPTRARQLIVSFSAKTRMAKDTDGDGIVEDSKGLALRCP